jgi:protein O-mannosyl-transferase
MKSKSWLKPLFLTLWVFFVFSSVVNFEFVNVDDTIHTVNNPEVNPPSLAKVPLLWRQPYRKLYIPLTYTLWEFIAFWAKAEAPHDPHQHSGLSPRPFHIVNLLLHWFVVVGLVYPLLRRLVGDSWAAWLGAAFFAVHPVQVESVAWISAMKDLFSGTLCLICLVAYVHYCDSEKRAARIWYGIAFCAFFAALFAKPSTVMLPFLLFALGYFFLKRTAKILFSELWFWFVLLWPMVLITSRAQASEDLEFTLPQWGGRVLVALDALRFYVGKLLFPFSIGLDYGETPDRVLSQPVVYWIGLLAIAAGVGVGLVRGRQRFFWVAGSTVIFVLCLVPILGFKPFVFQTISTVGDRYLYLAMLGPAIALAFALTVWQSARKKEGVVVVALLVGLYSLKSRQQVEVWRTSEQLFCHALRLNPKSWLSHNNLGVVFESKAEWDRAAEHYGKAGDLRPNATTFNNLGAVFLTQRQFYPALLAFKRALDLKQDDPLLYNNLGTVWMAVGQVQRAKEAFVKALSLDPELLQAKENLARVESLTKRG